MELQKYSTGIDAGNQGLGKVNPGRVHRKVSWMVSLQAIVTKMEQRVDERFIRTDTISDYSNDEKGSSMHRAKDFSFS